MQGAGEENEGDIMIKLVVGFWDLIPMESGYDNSEEQETSTVTKENEGPESKRERNLWWKEEKCPRMRKSLDRLRNTTIYGGCEKGIWS